jgi:hypothetical protein
MKNLSIIIPLANGRTISIQKENLPRDTELIIVEGKNPSKNRNLGVSKAKTKLVAFINGHTTLSLNWAEKVVEFFEKYPEIDIVGGPQFTPKNSNFFEKLCGYALGSFFGSGSVAQRYSGNKLNLNADETMITSANLICKKNVFDKVKFDEKIYPGEDPKFISDAKKIGFKVAFSPEIIVFNQRRSNTREFIIQNYNYGFTRTKKESFLETLKKPFFIAPSLFLIYLLACLTYFLVQLNKPYGYLYWIIFSPIFLYSLLSIIFSVIDSVKNRSYKGLFFLPFIYLLIHLSYGIGMIFGCIKNIKK